MAAETRSPIPRELSRAALVLATGAFCTVVYLTVRRQHDIFVYRIALLLIFFAISTVSALLFSAKASLTADWKGTTIAVGGPAALWLVGLVIFATRFPESAIGDQTLGGMLDRTWQEDQRHGWIDYPNWKKDLDSFSSILGTGESTTLQNLLWSAHYDPPGPKLHDVQVATVFLYFPKYTVKLQRLQGHPDGEYLLLNFGAQSSTAAGTTGSVLLVGKHNGTLQIQDSYEDSKEKERKIEKATIDCLIVSFYEEDIPPDGDYLVTDFKTWASDLRGDLRLGVGTFTRQINDPQIYSVTRRPVLAPGDLALRFHKLTPPVEGSLGEAERDLQPWLQLMDDAVSPSSALKPEPRAVLRQILDRIAKELQQPGQAMKASDLLRHPKLTGRWSFGIENANDVLLTLFLWK